MATTTFSMRMDVETKEALEAEAKLLDRSAAWVAQRAIQDYLAREKALHDSIRDALENDDGTRISGEAVLDWMSRWADGHDEPFPEPDVYPATERQTKSA